MSVPIEAVIEYCPRCGKPNESVGDLPFRCKNCDMTMFFGPVAAVGALVINQHDELLLVRRARDPGKGCWGLPGGFVDRGETIEEALRREAFEETKLELSDVRLLTTFPNQYNYRGVVAPVIDLFYVCQANSDTELSLAEDELDHFIWVRPTEEHLNRMAFESNRKAIEVWLAQ